MISFLDQLRSRGCVHDVSHPAELAEALSKQSLRFYCGFDPTADSLHVGSLLPLIVMRRLQRQGHQPILLIGSATGMIGDPSGKSDERKLLTAEQVAINVAGLERQVSRILQIDGKSGFQVVKNHEWLSPITYLDFLRDVGKHFSINNMLAKDSVKGRLEQREQGISYTEFSYMLLQAYDYYHLNKNFGCRLQIGGSDQWGNITAGIELIRRKRETDGVEQAFGLTFPLLLNTSGTKFGKTEQGTVWLDPNRTSPYRFYQFWLQVEDADVMRFLNMFTDLSDAETKDFAEKVEQQPERRDAQRCLASEMTDLIHGKAERERAEKASAVLFGGAMEGLDSTAIAEIFAEVPSSTISHGELTELTSLSALLVKTALAESKGAARRLIEGGGVYVNGARIADPNSKIEAATFIDESVLVLRSGKKNFHLVRLTQ